MTKEARDNKSLDPTNHDYCDRIYCMEKPYALLWCEIPNNIEYISAIYLCKKHHSAFEEETDILVHSEIILEDLDLA